MSYTAGLVRHDVNRYFDHVTRVDQSPICGEVVVGYPDESNQFLNMVDATVSEEN